MIPERVRLRFWTLVDVRGDNDCWPFQLSTGNHGYGQLGWYDRDLGKTVMRLAHRIAWEIAVGPIPEELTVGHRHDLGCLDRTCCNYRRHLVLLTNVENARDNGQARQTHCKRNHPFDEQNTYVDPRGHRRCRRCHREGYPEEEPSA